MLSEYDKYVIGEYARQEGFKEGKAEGIAKGKAEGEAKGRAEGKAEGKAEGRAEARQEDARKMIAAGFPKDEVYRILGLE